MSWIIDPAHTHLQFTVRHMMISKVRGTFDEFRGVVDYDPNNPANTDVRVTVDVASINTREDKRDGHLRSVLSANPFQLLDLSRIEEFFQGIKEHQQ